MSRDFSLLPIIPPRRTGETSIPFWYWDTGRNLFLSAHYFLFQPRREIANSVSSRGLDHLVVLLCLKGKQKEETSCLQSVSLLPALWVGKNCSLLEGPLRQGPRLEDPWLQYICLRKFACSHVRLFATPTACSPPDSSVHGILQARMLEWVAMPSSRGSSCPKDWTQVSCVSCVGGRFSMATWEPRKKFYTKLKLEWEIGGNTASVIQV